MSIEHLDDLRAQAKYARERYQLYKAKSFGAHLTSPARLRELQRSHEQSEARLHHATEAEEQRAPAAETNQQDSVKNPSRRCLSDSSQGNEDPAMRQVSVKRPQTPRRDTF
jgi:hypothetical protein